MASILTPRCCMHERCKGQLSFVHMSHMYPHFVTAGEKFNLLSCVAYHMTAMLDGALDSESYRSMGNCLV